MKNFPKLIGSIILCELVGLLGVPFNISSIPTWYNYLNKPFFSPPNWVFGPVWLVLYFLMGVSFYLVWTSKAKKSQTKIAIKYFLLQLFLNGIWSPMFFGLRSPFLGLIVIIFMWLMILLTMLKFKPISKLAFYLLIPYLLWVSFATVLNASIWILI